MVRKCKVCAPYRGNWRRGWDPEVPRQNAMLRLNTADSLGFSAFHRCILVGHRAMMTSLVRRGAAYYFRQRVPVDLAGRIGRRELRRSLGTRDPREARLRAARVRARADDLFEHLRGTPMLTDADCKFYARWWYQACMDEDWNWKQMAALRPDLAGDINDGFQRTRALTEANIIKELNSGDISRVVLQAEEALTEDGRGDEADENSADFRRLCAFMLRGALEAVRKAKAEEAADFSYEPTDPLFKGSPPQSPEAPTPVAPVAVAPAAPPPTGPSIASMTEPFITEKTNLGKVSTKTQNDYRASLALFMQVVGAARPVAAITGDDVVAFKNLLVACPTNFRKRLGTDNLREAVRLNAERSEGRLDTLDPKTINEKYLSNVKTFFDWARTNRLVKESPASGVRAEQPKNHDAVEDRHPFTVEDLHQIFVTPFFTETPRDRRAYRLWAPLIGLFSGCRLSEIGQLQTRDIVDLNGIPHFAIRDETAGQHLKTAAARRWVPVHSELVALGLLDYVARQGSGRLFPDWPISGDGYYSSAYSKWFGRLLTTAGVKTDKKSFHSFRHTAADALDEVVEASVRDKFLGHSSGQVRDRYGSKPPKQAWSEAFLRLSYPGLDLSHLQP